MISEMTFFGDGLFQNGVSRSFRPSKTPQVMLIFPFDAFVFIRLPNARGFRNLGGPKYYLANGGTFDLPINDYDNNLLTTLTSNRGIIMFLIDNAISAGTWDIREYPVTFTGII